MSTQMSEAEQFAALKLLSPAELDQVGYASLGGNTGANLAPYILGLFMDCLLLGVLIMQVNRWHTYCYHKERLHTKLLVLYVFVLNIGITVFLVVWNMIMFSSNFGRYRQFLSLDFASFFYLIDAMVRFPVSSFFAARAWRASGQNPFLAAVLGLLLLASLVLGITAKVIAEKYYASPLFITLSCVWLACHLACDLITTSVISIFLYKSKTGWSQTDALMIQLMVMTAETQLPPTILSLAFLIVYIANTHSAWPIFFVFSAKVFAICLVAVLNTKFTLRRELETSSAHGGNNTYALKSRPKQPTMEVHVATETYRERDDISMFEEQVQRKRGHGNELQSVTVDGQDANYRKMPDLEQDGDVHSVPQVRFN